RREGDLCLADGSGEGAMNSGNALEVQRVILGQTGPGPQVDPSAPAIMQFLQGHRIEAVSLAAGLVLVAIVFELVRRKQIKEKYSFLWFATGASLLLLTLKRAWLASLANLLGVYYPPTALFLVLSFFIILILVHFSIVVSRLLSQNQ